MRTVAVPDRRTLMKRGSVSSRRWVKALVGLLLATVMAAGGFASAKGAEGCVAIGNMKTAICLPAPCKVVVTCPTVAQR